MMTSVQAVDRRVAIIVSIDPVFHDLLVMRLVEAMPLNQLAHWRYLRLLKHSGVRLLQRRIHLEVKLSRLVRPMIHHLIHFHRDVARVRA